MSKVTWNSRDIYKQVCCSVCVCGCADISLYGVKQALSLLRWQRDRLDHLEASSESAPEGSFHLRICSMLVDIVSQVFNLSELNNSSKLLLS